MVVTVAAPAASSAAPERIDYSRLPKPQVFKNLPHQDMVSAAKKETVRRHEYVAAGRKTDKPFPQSLSVKFAAGQRRASASATGISLSRQAASAGQANVTLLTPGQTKALGVNGLAFQVTSEDPSVTPSVDFSKWAQAGSAGYAQRLRLVRLPACAGGNANSSKCNVATQVASAQSANTITATVPPAVSGAKPTSTTTTYALTSGASGDTGSFAATSLAPSSTWSVSGAGGGFNWSYPVPTPSPATGSTVAPSVSLDYSSASVDGKVATSNNQSSWVGLGWDYQPGFIERSYRTCKDDESLPSASQTSDLCWAGEVLTLQFAGGGSGRLVKDDTLDVWRVEQDNGARVEHLDKAPNGAQGGEYWRVTDTSGVQYYFGLNRPPGASAAQETNSVLTVPVYGAKPADPCYSDTGFSASRCAQAYRWNLDYVEDPNGNAAVYSYAKEVNRYGPNSGTSGVAYDRAGYLTSIQYGMHNDAGSVFTTPASYKVLFNTADRCTGTGCSSSTDPTVWPDTPIDLECTSGTACQQHSPSFWTRKRLASIDTQYRTVSGTYTTVDSVALSQFYAANGLPTLNLGGITRTGYGTDGSSITMPQVTLQYADWDNRVTGVNQLLSPMVMSRLNQIRTETGQAIVVSYNADAGQNGRAKPVCTSTTIPSDPSTNATSCYPVSWTPPFAAKPVLDYFHKYVVTQVSVSDINTVATSAPTRISTYTYLGDPAWHFDNNELVPAARRTYGQFRGYGTVEVRTGNPNSFSNGVADAWTLTKTSYYRGMDGDRLPSGSRRVDLGATDNSVVADADGFADNPREVQTFAGTSRVGSTITNMSVVATSATHARPDVNPLKATIVRAEKVTELTNVPAGGTTLLNATTTTTYDSLGRPVRVNESGSSAATRCTGLTYADNETAWIRDRPAENIVSAETCPAVGTAQTTSAVLSQGRVYYDNSTTLGAAPSAGNPTMTQTALDAVGGTTRWAKATTSYDTYGRAKTATAYANAADSSTARSTLTTYLPATSAPTTQVTITNALNQSATTKLDPSRGVPVQSTDVGGLVTDAKVDALGRVVAVWNPGQSRAGNANTTYTYSLTQTAPPSVTTKTLVDPGNEAAVGYATSTQILNAFGDTRQTQTQTASGRLITESFVDSHGWVIRTENGWPTTGAPSTTVASTAATGIDSRTFTVYDATGRATQQTAYQGTTAKYSTKTVYSGDRTTTIPPTGGVTTTSIINGRGKTKELNTWTVAPTISGNTLSGGTAVRTVYTLDALDRLKAHTTAYNTSAASTWGNTYDLAGRVTAATDPDSGARSTKYNDLGETITTTDAKNQSLTYAYDKLGRKTGQYSGATTTGTQLAGWTYDTLLAGQPTSSTRFAGGKAYVKAITGYDSVTGRPTGTSLTLDETGFLPSYTRSYTYTSTGQLATETMPVTTDGTRGGVSVETLTHFYNAIGQLTGTGGKNAYVADTIYSPWGEVSQHVLGINTLRATLTYDRDVNTHRVNHVDFSGLMADPQIADITRTYDNAGNITKTVDIQGGAGAATQTTCYKYDTLQQLTEAWSATDACATTPTTTNNTKVGGPQKFWYSWTLDAATGRRDKQTKNAVPSGPATSVTDYKYLGYTNGTVSKPRALTSTSTSTSTSGATTGSTSYGYDANGATISRTVNGVTNTIAYGADQRTSSISTAAGTISFLNDADGDQLLRRDPGGVTTLFMGGTEVKYTASTNKADTTRYYSHGGVTVAMRTNLEGLTYLMRDHHDTAGVAFKASAQTVTRRFTDPYGNALGTPSGTWPNQRGFLDKQSNPAGIVDIGAREYDPTLGRFLSVDPVLDPGNPLQANGYSYGSNNPVSFSDPTGEIQIAGDTYGQGQYQDPSSGRVRNRPGDGARGGPGARTPGAGGACSRCADVPSQNDAKAWLNVLLARQRAEERAAHERKGYNPYIGGLGSNRPYQPEGKYDALVALGIFIAPFAVAGCVATGVVDCLAAAYAGAADFAAGGSLLGGAGVGGGMTAYVTLRAAAKATPGAAVRPVGQVLESVEDVIANPSLLAGKHPAQVESILRGSPGWEVGTLERGRSAGSGWTFRERNSQGTDWTGRYIQWSPGSPRHFNGEPYWKVSSGELGTVRFAQ